MEIFPGDRAKINKKTKTQIDLIVQQVHVFSIRKQNVKKHRKTGAI